MAKITKRDMYNAMLGVVDYLDEQNMSPADEISCDDLREFIDHELSLLDAKAEAAKKRSQEKLAEGDPIRDIVLNALPTGDQWFNADDIVKRINMEDVSRAIVVNRIGQLIKLGLAEKDKMTMANEEGKRPRTITIYRRIG